MPETAVKNKKQPKSEESVRETSSPAKQSARQSHRTDYPWVVLSLDNGFFAVSAQYVQTMIAMPKIVQVPQAPDYARGVINLRGTVLPLVDMRVRLGRRSLKQETDEFIAMLDERKADHENWLAELEASVQEQREFTGQLDYRKCKFGQWYYDFHTDDLLMTNMIRKFEEPHKAVHQVGVEVEDLKSKGEYQQARALIDQARQGQLAGLLELFDEVSRNLLEQTREIAVSLETKAGNFAVAADRIESVEHLVEGSMEQFGNAHIESYDNELITSIARRQKEDKIIFILDVDKIVTSDDIQALQQ